MGNVVTLEPIAGISVPNKEYIATTGKTSAGIPAKPSKFVLFTQDWIQLQNFVAVALELPVTQGDFKEKYGEFTKTELITNAVDALKDLHDSAKVFGNPAKLWEEWAAKDLTTAEMPESLYGKIVWVAGQVMTKAESFRDTYENLEAVLDESFSEEKRQRNPKALLTGKGGLTDEAREMSAQCKELRGELAEFATRVGKSQEKIGKYFDEKTEICQAAEDAVADISQRIKELENERDSLQRQYDGAAAGAAAGSYILMVISGGMLFPAALGLGLGLGLGLAETYRKNRDATIELIGKRQNDKQKKVLLHMHIVGLNKQIGPIKEKVEKVIDGLGQIAMVWDDQIVRLDAIVKSTDFAKMIKYEAANQIMKIDLAIKKWNQIAEDTKEFRHGALVQYKSEDSMAA
jgi:DNA repair exonuclease SbcCD ATPase subunit